MTWKANPFSIPLFLAAATCVALLPYIWPRRSSPGALPLAILLAAVGVWSLGNALEMVTVEMEPKLHWVRVSYVGIVAVPASWLMFALQYAGVGRWLRVAST